MLALPVALFLVVAGTLLRGSVGVGAAAVGRPLPGREVWKDRQDGHAILSALCLPQVFPPSMCLLHQMISLSQPKYTTAIVSFVYVWVCPHVRMHGMWFVTEWHPREADIDTAEGRHLL